MGQDREPTAFFGCPDEVFEVDEINGAAFVLQITAKTGARL
jgi:hypothetical protein